MKINSFLFVAFCCLSSTTLIGQSGVLDSTFSGDGVMVTDYGLIGAWGNCLATQPNGKIIIGGNCWGTNSDNNFGLDRFNPDGSVDNTFGFNGKVVTDLNSPSEGLYSVAIQPDGKIIAMGSSNLLPGFSYVFTLVRYFGNGSIDTTFGNHGVAKYGVTGYDFPTTMVLQPDGNILIGGYTQIMGKKYLLMERYLPNGQLDSTFSSDGTLIDDIDSLGGWIYAMSVKSDGSIMVAGTIDHDAVNNPYKYFVKRYLKNGDADIIIFNHFGVVQDFFVDNYASQATSMAILPNGNVLIAGFVEGYMGKTQCCLAQYLPNGHLDPSFGVNGKSIIEIYQRSIFTPHISIQSDGKIIIGATSYIDYTYKGEITVIRCNSNGTIDSTFATNGFSIKSFSSNPENDDFTDGVALQADSKILLVGTTNQGGNGDKAVLMRYLTDLNVGAINLSMENEPAMVYPNPIIHGATLRYSITKQENISIYLINIAGEMIQTLQSDQVQAAGTHEYSFNLPETLPSGAYYLVIAGKQGRVRVQIQNY